MEKATLVLNEAIKAYGLHDKLEVVSFDDVKYMEFTAIKPFINSKRITLTLMVDDEIDDTITSMINNDFKRIVSRIHNFVKETGNLYGIRCIEIRFNKLRIITGDIDLAEIVPALIATILKDDEVITKDSLKKDDLVVINLNDSIINHGIKADIVFDRVRGVLYFIIDDDITSIYKNYENVLKNNVYTAYNANKSQLVMYDAGIYLFASFINTLKRMKTLVPYSLKVITTGKTKKLSVYMSPSTSIAEFTEELYDKLFSAYLDDSIQIMFENPISGELADIILEQVTEVFGNVKIADLVVNSDNKFTGIVLYPYNYAPHFMQELRYNAERFITKLIDDYYLDLVVDLFDIK